jgi:hypothetical protein
VWLSGQQLNNFPQVAYGLPKYKMSLHVRTSVSGRTDYSSDALISILGSTITNIPFTMMSRVSYEMTTVAFSPQIKGAGA